VSRLPVRAPGGRRAHRRPPARASAGHRSAERIGAAVVLVAAVTALLGLTTSGAFSLAPGGLELTGARYTSLAAVRRALGLDGSAPTNLITLQTAPLENALRSLPAVDPARADAASVAVALPDRLVVTLQERQPILVWQVGGRRYLVDVTGTLFAELVPGAPDGGLPIVRDGRSASATLAIGETLDPSDLTAVRQLAAVTPALLGSAATSLAVAVTDQEGFTLDAQPGLWHAVFGVYTATLRPATIVAAQVQCLASLIAARERTLGTIRLPGAGSHCGTYTTPAPHAAGPSPSATP
jgi:cell division septal protein FtsQ